MSGDGGFGYSFRDGDWKRLRQIIQKLTSIKLGPHADAIFKSLTLDSLNLGLLNLTGTTLPQLTVGYDATHYLTLAVDATGDVDIGVSGGDIDFGTVNLSTTGTLTAGATTLTGALNMSANLINNVADPIDAYDAVNLRTLESAVTAGLQWYLSNTASADISGYKLLAETNDAGQTIITVDGTSSGQALDEWATIAGSPGEITISEGEIDVHFYASVARVASTDFLYQIKAQIYKRTGATETQLGSDITSLPVLSTTTTLYSVHAHLTEPLTLVAGDRIVVKLSTVRTGTAPRVTEQVVSLYIGDVTPSHISLPVTLAILGNYVPYTGATTDVDLGLFDLAATTLTASGLTPSLGVYTTTGGLLTTTAPTSGALGYWSRTSTTLSQATANDALSLGSGTILTTGTLGAGVTTLAGNNGNASIFLLNLNNTDIPSSGEALQDIQLLFNFTQSVGGVSSLHYAAGIVAYKAADWFTASGEADTSAGLRFYTTNAGTPALRLTIADTGVATFTGNVTAATLTATGYVNATNVNMDAYSTLAFGSDFQIYTSGADDAIHFCNDGSPSGSYFIFDAGDVTADSFTEFSSIYNHSLELVKLDLTQWATGVHTVRLASDEIKAQAIQDDVDMGKPTTKKFGTDIGKAGKATAMLALDNEKRIAAIEQRLIALEV